MLDKVLVGLDIGGTTIKIALLDYNGEFIYKWEINTNKKDSGLHIINDISREINEKSAQFNISKKKILGIGLGAPGPFNLETGLIYSAVNIGWKNYPLKELLEKKTELPVFTDNDANIATLGETWKGAGYDSKDLVCVTLGTGVGAGIIANGKIVRGIKGAGGEIGHLTVIPEGGAPCNCGKTGCLETIASATGISRIAVEKIKLGETSSLEHIYKKEGEITSKDVFNEANNCDKLAKEIVDKTAFYLGLSLSHVANCLNPEKIIIGGGVSKSGDTLIKPLEDYFQKFCFPTIKASVDLIPAKLGNDAGVVGGGYLVKISDSN